MAAKKKAAKKAGKKATKKGAVAKKKIRVEAVPMTEHEVVLAEIHEVGIAPFEDPLQQPIDDLETSAKDLISTRNQNEAHLSSLMFAVEERRLWVDRGLQRKEYFEKRLGFSVSRANEMAGNWRRLVDLGVGTAKRLKDLSWAKLKALKAGIDAGKINKRNIDKWLEFCAVSGETALLTVDLERKVKEMVAKEAKEELDDTLKSVSFKVPAYELEMVSNFESIATTVMKTDNRGACFIQALMEFMANHAQEEDAMAWKVMGLAALKEMAERIAPVACVFIPLQPNVTREQLGVSPVLEVYQAFTEGSDGVNELQYCLATNMTEAKRDLKSGEVRAFPLRVSKSLMPKEPFRSYELEGEAEAVSKDEDSAAWKLADEGEVRKKMGALVKKLKVPRKTYEDKKVELKKALKKSNPDNLTLDQAILRWLIEMENGA